MSITARPTSMAEFVSFQPRQLPGTGDPANDPQGAPLPNAALHKLLFWLSPAFPVGGFSYSHGLEWAIEDATVTDADGLRAWIGDVLGHGAGWSDAVIFFHTYRAASSDAAGVTETNDLAVALQPSKERRLESTAQGRAFLSTVVATWPNNRLAAMVGRFSQDTAIAYPVAVALAAAAHTIPAGPAVNAYLGAFVANLVSAAVRAVPLGQSDGQRVIAALTPRIETVAHASASASLDCLGGSTWRADIASMKHETQYTRLFRS